MRACPEQLPCLGRGSADDLLLIRSLQADHPCCTKRAYDDPVHGHPAARPAVVGAWTSYALGERQGPPAGVRFVLLEAIPIPAGYRRCHPRLWHNGFSRGPPWASKPVRSGKEPVSCS
jgi:hypothetical protein